MAIQGYIDGGFRSAKLGLGKRGFSRAGRDPDYDVALVGALRHAIGPRPDIMVDGGNGVRWDVETAVRTTRRMEEFSIKWIEEPLHPSDVEGHRTLKAQTRTLVAAGEREWGLPGYRRWIENGAVDVFGIDPARVEGITGFRSDCGGDRGGGKDRQCTCLEHRGADGGEPSSLAGVTGFDTLRTKADPRPDAVRPCRRAVLARGWVRPRADTTRSRRRTGRLSGRALSPGVARDWCPNPVLLLPS